MYKSLSMIFVSLCCIVLLFNFVFFLIFLSLAIEIKLLVYFTSSIRAKYCDEPVCMSVCPLA